MKTKFEGRPIELEDPNICSHCHEINNPHSRWQVFTEDSDNSNVYITAWQCSNNQCKRIFLVQYKMKSDKDFVFDRYLNGQPKGPDWPKPILELTDGNLISDESPSKTKFIKTYLQSLEAEMSGLDELAGMGFRKAIEYLVKDWAIHKNSDEKDKIQKMWLGQVISEYFEGELKEILERATWLGNDQAHYLKLFEEYDIEVLKELIDLIMVELDRKYKMQHYIKTIQKRK